MNAMQELSMPHEAPASLEKTELGIRIAAFFVRRARWMFGMAMLGGVLGLAIGQIRGQQYISEAILEIGLRPVKEPLESPLLARARLEGFLLEAKGSEQPQTTLLIDNILDDESKRPTLLISVQVKSDTASVAQGVLDQGVSHLIQFHHSIQDYERSTLEADRARYGQWLKQIDQALDFRSGHTPEVQADEHGIIRERRLDPARGETMRLQNGLTTLLSEVRMVPTRLVSTTLRARPAPSPLLPLGMGGCLLGVFGAVLVSAFRERNFD